MQEAGSRRQEAGGRRQEAGSRRQEVLCVLKPTSGELLNSLTINN
jgi:hypothetical protein